MDVGKWSLLGALICSLAAADVDTLRFVHVVWRHGDRSPADPTFPTDTGNPESSWPQGWGQLTEIGMKQHYDLGTYMKQRYVDTGFLRQNYNASEIYVRSSDYNRTIMSALANLAGMYPPSDSEKFLPDLNWRPIPVHVVQKDNDPVLWMDRPCPKADSIYFDEVLVSNQARKVEADNAELLNLLRQKSGLQIPTLDDVRFIFDPLNCELIHHDKHVWPEWVTESLFAQIVELYRLSKTFSFNDWRLKRFRGSLLFWDIAQRSAWKANNDPSLTPSTLKYYVYSAHDTTLIALLENLGAYEAMGSQFPPYAAAALFELHEKDGKQVVKVLYVNETGSKDPVPVPVKGCNPGGECTLQHFLEMARAQTPPDWYAECGFQDTLLPDKYKRTKVAAEVLGATTALLLILLMVAVAQIIRRSGYRGFTA